jgi:hypothetical protein
MGQVESLKAFALTLGCSAGVSVSASLSRPVIIIIMALIVVVIIIMRIMIMIMTIIIIKQFQRTGCLLQVLELGLVVDHNANILLHYPLGALHLQCRHTGPKHPSADKGPQCTTKKKQNLTEPYLSVGFRVGKAAPLTGIDSADDSARPAADTAGLEAPPKRRYFFIVFHLFHFCTPTAVDDKHGPAAWSSDGRGVGSVSLPCR